MVAFDDDVDGRLALIKFVESGVDVGQRLHRGVN